MKYWLYIAEAGVIIITLIVSLVNLFRMNEYPPDRYQVLLK